MIALRSVLVSHPHGAAVANATAEVLAERGALARYFCGIATGGASLTGALFRGLGSAAPVLRNRILRGEAGSRVRSLAFVEGSARLLARAGRFLGVGPSTYDAVFLAHDGAVALSRWPADVDAVYAYEDAALWTFRRAARRGLLRIWDLPLPHYATLEQMWIREFRRWPDAMGGAPHIEPRWKKQRKDAELGLASLISVASAFTRASVECTGVRAPVVVTPYGFPVREFSPKDKRSNGPLTVLAVGTQDLRKGTPYLLEAWRRAGIRDARLRLVGPMRLSDTFLALYRGLFEHRPHIPRTQLGDEYRAADLVVFPTLGDGFGLVIQEAMCCGTPVLTTPCGGGPECITDGREGWLVPAAEIDPLVERLRQAARDRDSLARMGAAARTRAERWTWREAGQALARGLSLS